MKNFFKSKKNIVALVTAATVIVATFNPKVAGVIKLVAEPIIEIFYPTEPTD